MAVTQVQFERALLQVLKTVCVEASHIDAAIEDYLSAERIDEDDPSLWSELRHACHRLFRLIVVEGGHSASAALKLLVRLGVSRDIRGDLSVEWFGDGEPSRTDIAIRSLLHALRLSDPNDGLRWWRLYTMPKAWDDRLNSMAALTPGGSAAND